MVGILRVRFIDKLCTGCEEIFLIRYASDYRDQRQNIISRDKVRDPVLDTVRLPKNIC